MENSYQYFKRDLSWLSFNYRVLLEAEDDTLPIYERIKFLSIYSSNLEEFYEIRVAEHRGVIMKKNYSCLLYTSPSPRDKRQSRMPSSA